MDKVLLVIPAYNEESNIGKLLDNLNSCNDVKNIDILVINDASTDGTKDIVEKAGVKVISQIFNMGYGAALQTAYKYAVTYDYDYIVQIDADGQHDINNIKHICDKLGCFEEHERELPDIVIGSRFLEGSQSFYMSGLKMISIKMFRKIIKLVAKTNLTDPTSGLQGLNRKSFTYYSKYGNFDLKYPDMNMIVQMLLRGYRLEEVPSIMHERSSGVSMHTGLIKVGKYMILMMISTWSACKRNKVRKR